METTQLEADWKRDGMAKEFKEYKYSSWKHRYISVLEINVMLSPFNNILPSSCLDSGFFVEISTASSITKFINSSNPRILPCILRCVCSYNQMDTRACCCKYLKIKLMGGSIDFLVPVRCTDDIFTTKTAENTHCTLFLFIIEFIPFLNYHQK